MPKILRIAAPFVLLLVLAEAAGAAWFAWSTHRFLGAAVPATGRVVELERVHNAEGGDTFAPVFDWTDETGRNHRTTSSSSSRPAGYAVGDPIDLLHEPGDPAGVRVDGFFSLWGVPLILGGLALGQSLLFAVAFAATRKLGEQPAATEG